MVTQHYFLTSNAVVVDRRASFVSLIPVLSWSILCEDVEFGGVVVFRSQTFRRILFASHLYLVVEKLRPLLGYKRDAGRKSENDLF